MNNENWKTDGLPFVKVDDKLTVILPSGESRTVSSSEGRIYNEVLEAISEENWEVIPDLLSPKTRIENFSNGNFTVKHGQVFIGEEAVPDALGDKIIEYSNQNLPYQPLINFWNNLKENPSYRAVQGLFGFLLKHNLPITKDGHFVAYKGVRKDFTDCYTGKVSNKVGEIVEMPRNKVNEDPNQTCSYGLHISCWDFAHNSYGGGRAGHTLTVKVNPKDVVAVPYDYNEDKMRVCRYEVLSSVERDELKGQELYGYNPENYLNEDEDDNWYKSENDLDDDDWDDEDI